MSEALKLFNEKTTDVPQMEISTHFLGIEVRLNEKYLLKTERHGCHT